jgi:hypothetical protein
MITPQRDPGAISTPDPTLHRPTRGHPRPGHPDRASKALRFAEATALLEAKSYLMGSPAPVRDWGPTTVRPA